MPLSAGAKLGPYRILAPLGASGMGAVYRAHESREGWRTIVGVVIIPAILMGLLFQLPFMDRGLERRPWRRPIPVGGVLIVLIGLVWLGMTSRLDDSRDPAVAA